MTLQDFEDRLADLVTDAVESSLTLDEIIDGITCRLYALRDEVEAGDVDID